MTELATHSVEVVWGPKSRLAHVRADFNGVRVLTLCGRWLSGMMDNYWLESCDFLDIITCPGCRLRTEAKL